MAVNRRHSMDRAGLLKASKAAFLVLLFVLFGSQLIAAQVIDPTTASSTADANANAGVGSTQPPPPPVGADAGTAGAASTTPQEPQTTPTTAGEPAGPSADTAASASGSSASGSPSFEATLPPFTAVRACVPFAILIIPPNSTAVSPSENATEDATSTATATAPDQQGATDVSAFNSTAGSSSSSPANSTIYFTGDEEVANALDIFVSSSGVLSIGINNGFRSNQTINMTIVAPDATGLSFVQNFGSGTVVVGPGFNLQSFSTAATGLGNVVAYNLTAARVTVTNTGTSTVLLNGTFRDAVLVSGGTGKVYLAGSTSGQVIVRADGISTVWLQATPTTQISGTADALAQVLFTSGTCNVRSRFLSLFGIGSIFGDPCKQVQPSSGISLTPAWTCGIYVYGSSQCRGVDPSGDNVLEGQEITLSPSPTMGAADNATTAGAMPTEQPPVIDTALNATEPAPAAEGPVISIGAGTEAGAAPPPPPPPPSPPAAAVPAPPATTTTQGPPGTVTTGTFTTPGGFSSASGTVSGPGGTIGQQQTAQGGQPAQLSLLGNGAGDVSVSSSDPGVPLGLGIPELGASGLAVVSTPCAAPGPVPVVSM